jgi:endogenous inhibitor of DNA gyrase (YacG/DUF329 family)
MNQSEVWASYTPEERARRCAAISAGKFRDWAKRKAPRASCKVCGKPVSRLHGKYCSKACQHADPAWRKGPPMLPRNICPVCGKENPRPHLEYCSRACTLADPKFKEIHLPHLLRGQKTSAQPEIRKQAADKMRGRPQTALLTAKGPAHARAIRFQLRSPDGILYRGRNIRDFVRTHEDLFDPQDVIWRAMRYSKPSMVIGVVRDPELHCRASKGLGSLFGESKYVRFSWKGWTVKLP